MQMLLENDHLEVDLLRMIEGNVGNCGNWDMRIHRFKMMHHSVQTLAGPLKIRPEDGFPACSNNRPSSNVSILPLIDLFLLVKYKEFVNLMKFPLIS
jgi:hypothetical protein